MYYYRQCIKTIYFVTEMGTRFMVLAQRWRQHGRRDQEYGEYIFIVGKRVYLASPAPMKLRAGVMAGHLPVHIFVYEAHTSPKWCRCVF